MCRRRRRELARQGPLDDRELEIVRGMIDEYREHLERARIVREFWTKGRIIVVSTAAFLMWVVTIAAAIVQLRGHA